ncbi:MAG: hypothetical protein Q8N00_02370 [Nitrospirota bacterium]|nr:hypothetical protein [Nitrospirota bacterium]MDP3597715.1 hypothetical protein [Nitrospirota bacterium]
MSEEIKKRILSMLGRSVARIHQFRFGDRRNAQWIGRTVVCVCLAVLAGCASPSSTQPVRIHDIEILEHVSPQALYVATGDEVRWQNLRSDPVKIGLLSHHHLSLVLCEKGFTRLGMVDDTATIPPMGYVSLCFSRPGIVQYNVWLNPADPRGRMTPTARIEVSNLLAGRK